MREYKIKIVNDNLTDEELTEYLLQLEMRCNSDGRFRIHLEEIHTTTKVSSIKMVQEFHEVFSHPIEDSPTFPTPTTMQFRSDFIKEELIELNQAWIDKNLVEFADGLGDIQYVLDGWFLNAGLQDKKQAVLEEIHRSNMTKACKTEGEAQDTIVQLKVKMSADENLKYHYEQHGEYYIVYRSHDRKVMKSINYQPPNLKPIIYEGA